MLKRAESGSYHIMHKPIPRRVKLFSYGTLQLELVQLANFGRLLPGQPDALPGFSVTQMKIDDADVVATSGQTHHPVVAYSGLSEDRVAGRVFDISAEELQRADDYEVDSYRRDEVVLASGWLVPATPVSDRPLEIASYVTSGWLLVLMQEPFWR